MADCRGRDRDVAEVEGSEHGVWVGEEGAHGNAPSLQGREGEEDRRDLRNFCLLSYGDGLYGPADLSGRGRCAYSPEQCCT